MNKVLTLLTVLFFASPVVAAERVRIFVQANGTDHAGARLASALRDQIASSPRYILADGTRDALFVLYLSTLDPDGGGLKTTFARALTRYRASPSLTDINLSELFEYQNVGVCGKGQIDSCASGVMALVDARVVALRPKIESEIDSQIKAADEELRRLNRK